ncbi:MAG: hypothetical protein A3D95_02470 [Betaproteobacteria bacterium RIFCSPHIGHO2_12_FULL_69_13]|nr:MAG: hypothetical protein A3D95_02470 [Betaproteobacteria bacterium RIFCSPHIGHO2_12_FULL_69_13]
MAELFKAQLDYVFFLYGLAFVVLGAVCFALGDRRPRDLPWRALGAFGLAHGAHEWLVLAALSAGDTPAFLWARLVVLAGSFLPLAEFARLGAARLGRKVPGRWIHAPALLLVALAAVAIGPAAGDAVARYALGFTGGVAAGAVLALLARELAGAEKRWILLAATGLGLYGVAAGAVVPAAPFWPALLVNQEAFFSSSGIPVQLVRGLLAAWLAISVWGLRRQRIIEDHSAAYAGPLRLQFAWTAIAFAATLGAGWALTDYLGRYSEQRMRDDVRGDLSLLANRLRMEVGAADSVARSMADSPWVLPALAGGSPLASQAADGFVDAFKNAAGEATIAYLMDRDGTVVASSNRFDSDSLVGKNYRFRPYFRQAAAGQCTHYYALGVTTGERGYYASCPARDASGRAAGVAVVKKTLDAMELEYRQFEHAFFIDPNSVVFLASDSQALFRTLWPLPEDARQALSRSLQFGELRAAPLLAGEIADGTWVEFEGERHYAGRRYIGDERWSFVTLRAGAPIAASRALGIIVTLLFAVLSLVHLVWMEQLVRDKIALAKRVELEQRAATDALTGVANRLKFDQALADEIARAKRYGTPLALVMCDVDHFKAINDTHGHQAGDSVLVGLCGLIQRHTRKTDLLARWGGEEFVILARNCGAGDTFQLAEKLRHLIETHAFDKVGAVTCSFGVAQFGEGDSAESALARADAALYRAKASGRNRVETA